MTTAAERPTGAISVWAAAGLTLLVALFHGPNLANGFVYDDAWTLVTNPVVKDPGNLPRLLGPALARRGVPDAGRPTMLASEILDHEIWGPEPWGYHLQNLLWHLGVVLLVFFGSRRLHGSLGIALASAALVAVHPLGVEAVAAINYREDLLSTFFLLLALTLTEAARASAVEPGRLRPSVLRIGAFLVALVACLAKESAYVLPVLLVTLDLCRPASPASRARWLDPLLLGVAVVLIVAWRWWVIGALAEVSRTAEVVHPETARAVGRSSLIFFQGLCQFLWPIGLSPEYTAPQPGPAGSLLAAFSLALLMAAALFFRRRSPWLSFGLLFAGVAYLPHLGLVPLTNLRADRYFYLPMLGFALALVTGLAGLIDHVPRLHGKTVLELPAMALVAAAAVFILGLLSLQQGRIWRNDLALFSVATRVAPASQRAWIGLAGARLRAGQLLASLSAAREALALGDDFHARQMLGLTLLAQGDATGARVELERALADAPPIHHRAEILNNLGYAELKSGKTDDALRRFALARHLDPDFDRPWLNAARALLDRGDIPGALALLTELVATVPASLDGWKQLGGLQERSGRLAEAAAAYERARALAPGDPDVARALDRLHR